MASSVRCGTCAAAVHCIPRLRSNLRPIFTLRSTSYLSALLSHVTGINYPTLRILSITGALTCFAAIYSLVRLETRRYLPALIAVGCFATCYPWILFDGGHVDMLCLGAMTWAIYFTRRSNTFIAALLWVVAFQSKQGVLPVAVLFLCSDWQRPRRMLTALAVFGAALLGSILLLDSLFHGWYRYYVFGLFSSLPWEPYVAKRYLAADILAPYGIAVVIAVAALIVKRPHWRNRSLSFYVAGTVGLVLYSGYVRAKWGAAINAVTPAYIWIAVLLGVAVGKLQEYIDGLDLQTRTNAAAVLVLAVSVQLTVHVYSPTLLIPSAGKLAARNSFEQQIRSIPGNVLIASHAEDGVAAGKPTYAGTEAILVVVDAADHRKGDPLLEEYRQLFHSGTLSAVVLDNDVKEYLRYLRVWLPRDVEQLFPLRVAALGSEEQPGLRPKWILLPCTQEQAAVRLDPHIDLSPCHSQSTTQ